MKKYSCLILILICVVSVKSQTSNWLWAKSAGGTSIDKGNAVTTDTNGHVIVAGFFQSDSIVFGTNTLTNTGTNTADMFLVKYDTAGNVLWAKSVGGVSNDKATAVCTDANGDIFVAGSFQSDSITFGMTTLFNSDSTDIFIVKYDANGNVIWAKAAGGSSDENINSMCTDGMGNVIITGYFQSNTISFDTFQLLNTGIGFTDIFLVKYSNIGNVLWAKSAGSLYNDQASDVTTDIAGNVFITGNTYPTPATFGTVSFSATNFIAKYNAFGDVLWAKPAANDGGIHCTGMAADVLGNVFITGAIGGPSTTIGNILLTNNGINSSDFLIAKFNPNGDALWAKNVGQQGSEFGTDIVIDANGNALITGYFQDAVIIFGSDTLQSTACQTIFITQYDANGNVLWAITPRGISCSDKSNGIALGVDGHIFITGFFESPQLIFGTTTLLNAGIYNYFVAKLNTNKMATKVNDIGMQLDTYSISPNPFSYETLLHSNTIFHNGTLRMYNMQGELIKEMNHISGQDIPLRREHLPTGIYLIQFSEDDKKYAPKKVVIID